MKKKVFSVLLMMALACSLFAAGQGEAAEGGKKTIEVFMTKPVWADGMPELIAAFNESYPDIEVQPEIVGGGTDWRPVLSTKSRTGSLPDVFMIEGAADFGTWGEFLDGLSDMDVVDHFLPIAKESAYNDGKLMGLPTGIEAYGYIYNKDLFKKAGIAKVPETMAELEEAVAKLKSKGITPFVSGYGTWWVISNHQFNIPFAMQDDPKGLLEDLNAGSGSFAGNPEFEKLQSLIDMIADNSSAAPLTEDHHMQVSLFAGGKAAMIQQGNWKEKAIYDANPDINMGLMPIPLSDDPAIGGRIPVGVPWYFVVNKESEENAEAKIFLNWLLNEPAGQEQMVKNLNTIPAYDHFDVDLSGGISSDALQYSAEGKTIPWTFGLWPKGFMKNAADHFQAYVGGKTSYDETLKKLLEDWNSLK